jgi:hypothetical protein
VVQFYGENMVLVPSYPLVLRRSQVRTQPNFQVLRQRTKKIQALAFLPRVMLMV